MLYGQDYDTLRQILGHTQFPQDLLDEYLIRSRMLNQCGCSGQLGPMGLIELCRSLGIGPRVEAKDDTHEVDWRKVDRGTTVMCNCDGQWKSFVFDSLPERGRIGVRSQGDTFVHEFDAHSVRMPTKDEYAPPDVVPPEPEVVGIEKINTDEACDPTLNVRWSEVSEGTPIVMSAGEEDIVGEFSGLSDEPGCLVVRLDNRYHTVMAEDVQLKPADEPEAEDQGDEE